MNNEQPQSEQLLAGHPQDENQVIAERRARLTAPSKGAPRRLGDFVSTSDAQRHMTTHVSQVYNP